MDTEQRRKTVRTRLRAAVKLRHRELGEMLLYTRDISDSGAYLLADGQALPGIGELVEVQVQGLPGEPAPVVPMQVARVDGEGIGLVFLDRDFPAA